MRTPLGRVAAAVVATSMSAALSVAAPPADRVLLEARVWTADPARPWAEAVAIREGRFVYVGDAAGAQAHVGEGTVVHRFPGGLVLPGINDGHIHLLSGALSLERVDLFEDETLASVQAHIREFAAQHPERPWVLGRGWLYGAFPGGLPTKQQLDAAVPDRPAYMECYDGHSGWANSKALALAGITRETPDPVGGVIVRDPETGEPTGALKETAVALVESHVPAPDAEARYRLLLQALAQLNAQGVTAAQDAGYGPDTFSARDLPLLERAKREGKLSVRLRISISLPPEAPAKGIAEAKRLAALHDDPLLRFGAVKGYVDGVIEAKTAAMLEPYAGTEERGLPNFTPEALNAAVVEADREGLQVWLHAIGDRGVRMALDAHEAALQANGRSDRRGKIEHVETIHPDDGPRFAALGVLASMQPLHADPNPNIFGVWAPNAGERAAHGFGWKSLEQAGARLVFGSDWPVVTSDVQRGLYCAVARKTRRQQPPEGWLPQEAVSLESALSHYTIDAAFAAFEEKQLGSLEVGKRADVVVLADDVFGAPPEAILKTRVLLTLLDGGVVYEAEGAPARK